MIRVKVDLVPFGNEERSEQVGELILANRKTIGLGTCEYDAVYKSRNHTKSVRGITHARQQGFWKLIELILSAEGEEVTENYPFNRDLLDRFTL